MRDKPAFQTCLCNHCSQKLEFPVYAVGTEIQCPACGETTLLYGETSIPVPPPVSAARPAPSADAPSRSKVAAVPALDEKKKVGPAWKSPSRLLLGAGLVIFIFLVTSMIAIQSRKTTISGQVFIVTESRENVKLGAVEIVLVEKQQVADFLRTRQIAIDDEIKLRRSAVETAAKEVTSAEANAAAAKLDCERTIAEITSQPEYVGIRDKRDLLIQERQVLQQRWDLMWRQFDQKQSGFIGVGKDADEDPQIRAVGSAINQNENAIYRLDDQLKQVRDRITSEEELRSYDARIAAESARSDATNLRHQLEQFPRAADYLLGFSSAVSVAQRTLTDADGRFSLTCPRGEEFAFFATAQRAVPGLEVEHTETYYWLVDAPTASSTSQIFLSNNNLAEIDPDGYFRDIQLTR